MIHPENYVITIFGNKKSEAAAKRCIASGLSVGGISIEKWRATVPNAQLSEIIKKEGINTTLMNEVYSRTQNCIAAFLSHYSLWKRSVEENAEVTIFEHDAVCVNNVPSDIRFKGVLSFGAPSYGKFNTPSSFGVVPLQSKKYLPGAHAYRVKPEAAQMLIDQARMEARPTDVFLNVNTFPFLEEHYPWPVEARDSFTTIQSEIGCKAKHNKVEIIEA
tara:strand:- start:2354 stop:3007 length:654 start_codon:yes stop_codon:yes gene_type:complete